MESIPGIYPVGIPGPDDRRRRSGALIGLTSLWAKEGIADRALELAAYVGCHAASSREARERALSLRNDLLPHLSGQQMAAIEKKVQDRSLASVLAELLESPSSAVELLSRRADP
jgi:hypothetical protein